MPERRQADHGRQKRLLANAFERRNSGNVQQVEPEDRAHRVVQLTRSCRNVTCILDAIIVVFSFGAVDLP